MREFSETNLAKLMSLGGRRVLLTGGAGHIGVVMAQTLAEMGADVLLVDRDVDKLKQVASTLEQECEQAIKYRVCDLEDENARLDLIKAVQDDEFGPDILVNNAAFVGTSGLPGWSAPFEEQSVDTWRRAFEVNVTAAFHLSQAFLPQLRSSGRGAIVNIGSIYGELGPDWNLYEGTTMANPAAYSASKGGLLQLTRWLATTIAPDVRVNAISPGGVARGQPLSFISKYEERCPLGRMAEEDDFRGAIAYLASDLSAYVTGQTLVVDGGWSTW